MARVRVELTANYGYGCCGQCYGSNKTIEIEISDIELAALKKINENKVSCETIIETIKGGDTTLQSLHEQLEEEFYYIVEEYWLFEAYNECVNECLAEHIEQDIHDGLYTPVASDINISDCQRQVDIDHNDEEEDPAEDYCEDEDYEDEDDCDNENDYDLDAYYEWVKEHDHEFIAERVGLDLYACRDDEVNYMIYLDK